MRHRELVLVGSLVATLLLAPAITPPAAAGEIVSYDLVIALDEVNITGRPVQGMTINGRIPGPTLRFRVGDTARIKVRNELSVPTSIHWHGVLVPPGMDGVPMVSFPPIASGTTFTYEFPVRHSGTYWYHSHSGLQEQRGVYGSMVLEPKQERYPVDHDQVVLFSDWTDEDPHSVIRTLKRGSEWYALEKGSAQSILGAARIGRSADYWKRELSRMPAMDIADVAYDRFLANGRPEITLPAESGERIRLRIIDGSATTYFHLQYAGGPLTIIAADGQDVEPLDEKIFLLGVAETYDLLVTVPDDGAYELRATAHDGSGYASVWIGTGHRHPAPDLPRPDLYRSVMPVTFARVFALTPAGSMGMSDRKVKAGLFDDPGMNMAMGMATGGMEGMGAAPGDSPMSGMKMSGRDDGNRIGTAPSPADTMGMPAAAGSGMALDAGTVRTGNKVYGHSPSTESFMNVVGSTDIEAATSGALTPGGRMFGKSLRYMAADVSSSGELAPDGMDPRRPRTPYRDLRSIDVTKLSPDSPVREIRLTLDGDMERYAWFMGGKALSETDSILIRRGETVRFIMINRTMMHHPMHLHGHFFRVLNGQGDHSPLKHTVDVAPMSTTVIEFAADETGDWFFHCHLLYHMKSGMARLVHYEGYEPGSAVREVRPALYRDSWYAWGEADLLGNMTEGRLTLSNTRNIVNLDWEAGWENVPSIEKEWIFAWNYYVNRFTAFFAGADYEKTGDDEETLGFLGLHYLLPLNLELFAWADNDGGGRIGIEKEFALTPRFSLTGEWQYDSHDGHEGKGTAAFLVNRRLSLLVSRHSDFEWGAGIRLRF